QVQGSWGNENMQVVGTYNSSVSFYCSNLGANISLSSITQGNHSIEMDGLEGVDFMTCTNDGITTFHTYCLGGPGDDVIDMWDPYTFAQGDDGNDKIHLHVSPNSSTLMYGNAGNDCLQSDYYPYSIGQYSFGDGD